MFTPYFGEFLTIPMPIEMSHLPCSNNCAYCFSNLNKYREKRTIGGIFNQIKNSSTKTDTISMLLKEKYGVCISNRTDPFASVNYKNTIKICETLTELGVPQFFQTKGGQGIDECLSFLNPSIWYVTICQDTEELRKKIEPGAPSIKERLKLIKKLTAAGHRVNVGINPFVPEWVKNPKNFVEEIKNSGCYGITVEGLHFSHSQIKNLSEKQISYMGEDVVSRARKKRTDFEVSEYLKMCDLIRNSGMEVWSFFNLHESHLWDPYYEFKNFPIFTNFTNYVISEKKVGDKIFFNEFIDNLGGDFPNFKYKIDSYIFSVARNLYKEKKIPVYGNIEDLLKIFWSEYKIKISPPRHPYLSYLVDIIDKKTLKLHVDEYGLPIVIRSDGDINNNYLYATGDGKGVK